MSPNPAPQYTSLSLLIAPVLAPVYSVMGTPSDLIRQLSYAIIHHFKLIVMLSSSRDVMNIYRGLLNVRDGWGILGIVTMEFTPLS